MNGADVAVAALRALVTAVQGGAEIFSMGIEKLVEDLERNPEAVDRGLVNDLRDMDFSDNE